MNSGEILNSLTFSMHHNQSVYAVLLGSGISRAAGILTGWEITLDLVSQLAKLSGSDVQDLEKWYSETYKVCFRWSSLLYRVQCNSVAFAIKNDTSKAMFAN